MSTRSCPAGWDEARVREVLAHYEAQSADEQFADIKAGLEGENVTMIAVPTKLAPEVRTQIARAGKRSPHLEQGGKGRITQFSSDCMDSSRP